MADLSLYRNIGIFARVDAGKTTTRNGSSSLRGAFISLARYTTAPLPRTSWIKSRSGGSPSSLRPPAASGRTT